MLAGMHKGVQHVGQGAGGADGGAPAQQAARSELRQRLQVAIDAENYEEAAGCATRSAGSIPRRRRLAPSDPMMRFSTLVKHPADWMTAGRADNAVVLTSRIRLARNLAEVAFPGWATKEQRIETLGILRPAVEGLDCMKEPFSQELEELSSVQKQVLVERHLISREHAARGEGSAAVIERKQTRLRSCSTRRTTCGCRRSARGSSSSEAYELVSEVDDQLADGLEYAFDHDLGYLTTCPTNLGTGLRGSAMLHLPGLVLSDQIGQVLQAVNKIGLAVRGIFGEGTESLGNLFQISNQSTLGESEETILRRLERVISQVATHERNARDKLMEDDPEMVCDKIGRAYGVLAPRLGDRLQGGAEPPLAAPAGRGSRVFSDGGGLPVRRSADGDPARPPADACRAKPRSRESATRSGPKSSGPGCNRLGHPDNHTAKTRNGGEDEPRQTSESHEQLHSPSPAGSRAGPQGSRPLQPQLRRHRAPAARADQAGAGGRGERAGADGARPRVGADGSREAGRHRQ